MKLAKRILALTLAFLLMFGNVTTVALAADDGAETVTETAEPTAAPAEEPAPEPTAGPEPEPTAAPTAEPVAEPPAEPAPEPTEAPAAEQPAEPAAPTAEPVAEQPVVEEPAADANENSNEYSSAPVEAPAAPAEEPSAEEPAAEEPEISTMALNDGIMPIAVNDSYPVYIYLKFTGPGANALNQSLDNSQGWVTFGYVDVPSKYLPTDTHRWMDDCNANPSSWRTNHVLALSQGGIDVGDPNGAVDYIKNIFNNGGNGFHIYTGSNIGQLNLDYSTIIYPNPKNLRACYDASGYYESSFWDKEAYWHLDITINVPNPNANITVYYLDQATNQAIQRSVTKKVKVGESYDLLTDGTIPATLGENGKYERVSVTGAASGSLAKDVTVTAYYKLKEFTVSYSVDGDKPDGYTVPGSASVSYGTSYHVADVPAAKDEYDGYGNVIGTWTFDGWKLPDGSLAGETITVTGNVTLTGEWTYKLAEPSTYQHNVTYNVTGAPAAAGKAPVDENNPYPKGKEVTVDTAYGETVVEKNEDGSYTVWTFSGWTADELTIADGKFTMPDHDVILTGSWTSAKYTATVTMAGWTYGEEARAPVASVKKDGEAFEDYGDPTYEYYSDAECTTPVPVEKLDANGKPWWQGTYYVQATWEAVPEEGLPKLTATSNSFEISPRELKFGGVKVAAYDGGKEIAVEFSASDLDAYEEAEATYMKYMGWELPKPYKEYLAAGDSLELQSVLKGSGKESEAESYQQSWDDGYYNPNEADAPIGEMHIMRAMPDGTTVDVTDSYAIEGFLMLVIVDPELSQDDLIYGAQPAPEVSVADALWYDHYSEPTLTYATKGEDGSWSEFTSELPKYVGEYQVKANWMGDTYLPKLEKTVGFQITPRTITINKEEIKPYTGEHITMDITGEGVPEDSLVYGDVLTLSASITGCDAGEYTKVVGEDSLSIKNGEADVSGNYDVKITGKLTITPTYTVTYEWSGLPGTVSGDAALPVLPETVRYGEGDSYTVDGTFTAGMAYDDSGNGLYTFSGWDKSGEQMMGAEPVIIRGTWTKLTVPSMDDLAGRFFARVECEGYGKDTATVVGEHNQDPNNENKNYKYRLTSANTVLSELKYDESRHQYYVEVTLTPEGREQILVQYSKDVGQEHRGNSFPTVKLYYYTAADVAGKNADAGWYDGNNCAKESSWALKARCKMSVTFKDGADAEVFAEQQYYAYFGQNDEQLKGLFNSAGQGVDVDSNGYPTRDSYVFTGWEKSPAGGSTDVTFTAQWAEDTDKDGQPDATETNTITVKVTGGTASADGETDFTDHTFTVDFGGSLDITFKPDEGYAFSSATVDDVPVDLTSNTYTFSDVTDNHEIEVEYKPVTLTVTGGEHEYDYQAFGVTTTLDDPTGTVTLEYSADGGENWSADAPTVFHVGDGTKSVTVRAIDALGNVVVTAGPVNISVYPHPVTIKSSDVEAYYSSNPTGIASGFTKENGVEQFYEAKGSNGYGSFISSACDGVVDAGTYKDHFTFTLNWGQRNLASQDPIYESDYDTTIVYGDLIINPRYVTVNETLTVPYTGETQTLSIEQVGTALTVPRNPGKTAKDLYARETLSAALSALKPGTYTVTKGEDGKWVASSDDAEFTYKVLKENGIDDSTQNYVITFNLTLNIVDAQQSVSMPDWTYGDEHAGPTVNPPMNGDTPFGYGEAEIVYVDEAGNETTEMPRDAGSYTVKATWNGEGLPELTAESTFTITPAQLTVKAPDLEKVYGSDDPDLNDIVDGAEVTGWKYQDDTAIGKDQLKLTGTIDAHEEDVGEYPDVLHAATAEALKNYTVKYVPGKLTIKKAEATAYTPTVSQGSWIYGEEHPVVKFSVTGPGADKYGAPEITYLTVNHTAIRDDVDENGVPKNVDTYIVKAKWAETDNLPALEKEETFQIYPRPIMIKSAGGAKVYDGEPLIVNETTQYVGPFDTGIGGVNQGVYVDDITWADKFYPMAGEESYVVTFGGYNEENPQTSDAGWRVNYFDIEFTNGGQERNYKVVTHYGDLRILPRPVIFQSDDLTKDYDGTPLKAGAYGEITSITEKDAYSDFYLNVSDPQYALVAEDGKVGGLLEEDKEFLTLTYQSISRTEVGTTENGNGFIARFNGSRVSGNYDVQPAVYGDLIVTMPEPTAFTGTVAQGDLVYGAQPEPTADITSENPAVDEYGDPPAFTYYQEGSDTPMSEKPKYVGSYKVVATWAGDENRPMVTAEDTFEITKRAITINNTDTQTYTGEDIVMPITQENITDGELAYNDVLTLDASITGRAVGEYTEHDQESFEQEALTIKDEVGKSVIDNYDVTVTGTLTITAKSIAPDPENPDPDHDIEIDSPENVTYDGAAHQWAPEAVNPVTDEVLVAGTDYTVEYSTDDFTNVTGEITVTITGRGNYSGMVTRTYQINPATVTVTTEDASRTYNGDELTAPGTITGLVSENDATLNVTGTQTDAGTSQNTYNVQFSSEQMARNYTVVEGSIGTLTVDPATLTVNTGSAARAYNGQPLTAPGHIEGLVGNETATVNVTSSITDRGTEANDDYTIVWNGTAKEDNYEVEDGTMGTLTVDPATLTVNTGSATRVYNGQPLTAGGTIEGLVGNETATVNVTSSITNRGTAANDDYDIVWNGTAKENNYEVERGDIGTLTVNPATLTVNTASAARAYNGQPLTAGGTIVGLVGNETATVNTTDSQTNVGSTPNDSYTIAWGTARANNYTVRAGAMGTLTVNPATLTVNTSGAMRAYNGQPLTAGATLSGLVNGETATVRTTDSRTNAGTTPNDSYTITWGTAEANNYEVVEGNIGTLTVNRRAVTLTSGSASKQYDGTAVTANSVTVTSGSFAAGEGFTYNVTGRRIIEGSSRNMYSYSLNANTNAANYNITQAYGTLTIAPAPVVIPDDDTPLGGEPEATPAPTATPAATEEPEPTDEPEATEEPENVNIDDDTPLGGLPAGMDGGNGGNGDGGYSLQEEVNIEEGDTPLGGLPFTEHSCCILHFILMLCALLVTVYFTHDRKKRQEREYELRSELQ